MAPLTGLLLGAGASFEAGMPLVWQLTSEIKEAFEPEKLREVNVGARAVARGYDGEVLEDFISVLGRAEMHYEAVLGYLQAQFKRKRQFSQQYHGLYSLVVDTVYRALYLKQVENRAHFEKFIPFYDGLRSLCPDDRPLWVFSLNHDVVIEAIAGRLGLPIYSGFSSEIVRLPRRDALGRKLGEVRAEVLTKNDLERTAMHFPNPPRAGIYLLKIHGSLDQFVYNDQNDLLRLLPETQDLDGVVAVLRAANEELPDLRQRDPRGMARVINEIPYTDDAGVTQFLRKSLLAGAHKFDPSHPQVLPPDLLKQLRTNLNFVTNLICIGYSFGDNHINDALRDWLELSDTRTLHIVDVSVNKIPPFLLHLSPQVTTEQIGATDFFDSRAGIVRSEQERLEKRLANVGRAMRPDRFIELSNTFWRQDVERMMSETMAKLGHLPKIDGKPDFSSLGDPAEVARLWAAESGLDPVQGLRRLVEHLEAVPKASP